MIVTLPLLFIQVAFTLGFPSGAPRAACPGLLPKHHGTAPQGTSSPFEIAVSSVNYSPNTPLTVTINSQDGNQDFVGFLLQARVKGTNTSVGQFTSPPSTTKLLTCHTDGDSITHAGTTSKTRLQLTWIPPSSDMGEIEIRGAVAQTKLVYWGVLSSGPMAFSGTVRPATTSTSQGTTGSGGGNNWSGSPTLSSSTSSTVTSLLCVVLALLR